MELDGKTLKRIREELRLTQAQFADKIGVSQGRYSKWERDENEPAGKHAIKILELAGILNQSSPTLVPLGAGNPVKQVRVVGELQAGVWREALESTNQFSVPVAPPPGLENCYVEGFMVKGDFMNKYYPDGTLVFVEPTISTGKRPKSGQHVLVQRRNKNGLYEATLKEYVVNEDGTRWLWPRSHHPEHQAPVAYNDGVAEEVTITGIVRFFTASAP
ncbi:helix-turn-helix domain-containing protein [Phyllobacteriaceae bacterium JZ32]